MKRKITKNRIKKDPSSTKPYSHIRRRSIKMKSNRTTTPREARAKRNAARREKQEKNELELNNNKDNVEECSSPENKKRNSQETPPTTLDVNNTVLPISIQDVDIQDMLKEGLSMKEIEHNVNLKAAHIKLKAQQKADRSVAVFLRTARLIEDQKAQVSSATNSNEDQSGNDCNVASQP